MGKVEIYLIHPHGHEFYNEIKNPSVRSEKFAGPTATLVHAISEMTGDFIERSCCERAGHNILVLRGYRDMINDKYCTQMLAVGRDKKGDLDEVIALNRRPFLELQAERLLNLNHQLQSLGLRCLGVLSHHTFSPVWQVGLGYIHVVLLISVLCRRDSVRHIHFQASFRGSSRKVGRTFFGSAEN